MNTDAANLYAWITGLTDIAIGERHPHMRGFHEQKGYDYRTWTSDKSRMLPLIAPPLREAWQERWNEHERREAKRALQYVLNHDEHIQPRTRENGSVCDDIFAAAQDLVYVPPDSYNLCLWMWEALFGDEDWHADITSWTFKN